MKRKIAKILALYSISVLVFSCVLLHVPGNDDDYSADVPRMISVYRTETRTVSLIPMETYVAGVVACEMSSSFHIEALKAQAVASRTYAAAKAAAGSNPDVHPLAPVCDSTHCQVYRDSFDYDVDWDKVNEAVRETESEMLYYDGELVKSALYHASSGGSTENSQDVFVSAVPYLKSVDSPYEEGYERNGHGVGMSQRGANGMAKEGYTYKEILAHYYSGTVLQKE